MKNCDFFWGCLNRETKTKFHWLIQSTVILRAKFKFSTMTMLFISPSVYQEEIIAWISRLNFQGIISSSKFPGGLVKKVRQYPCIIFWNSPMLIREIQKLFVQICTLGLDEICHTARWCPSHSILNQYMALLKKILKFYNEE